jgi:hypothetical protein
MRKFKRGAWKYYNRIMIKANKPTLTWQQYKEKAGF